MEEEKLKPCPFCGGEAGIYKRVLDWATWDYKLRVVNVAVKQIFTELNKK